MAKSLQERIDALLTQGAMISKKENEKRRLEQEKPQEKISHNFPVCSANTRPLPNAVLRSALFGIVGKGLRRYEENALKASINGITVKFTGNRLDQNDLDVWLECINRLKEVKAGEMVKFSSYGFLKAIGRKTGKYEYEWLKSCLTRLAACLIELGDGRLFYSGHILDEKYRDEESHEFIIVMNPKFIVFFTSDMWTGLSIEERKKLKGKQLSLWLHGFFNTHREPFPYKVDSIRNLSGSDTKSLKKFKQNLKKSLDDLSSATGWKCWIDGNDLVHVSKK